MFTIFNMPGTSFSRMVTMVFHYFYRLVLMFFQFTNVMICAAQHNIGAIVSLWAPVILVGVATNFHPSVFWKKKKRKKVNGELFFSLSFSLVKS